MATETIAQPSKMMSEDEKLRELEKFQPTPTTRRFLSYMTLMFIGVFVFVGLPIWWRTTSTYRAWLPRASIHSLSAGPSSNVVVSVRLVVLNMDSWLEADQLAVFEQQLFDELAVASLPKKGSIAAHSITMNYHGLVRQCVGNELEILSTSTSLKDLEDGLVTSRSIALDKGGFDAGRRQNSFSTGDTYYIILLPNTTRLLPSGPGLTSAGLVRASNKITFIRSSGDLIALRSVIVRLMNKVLVRETELRNAYETTLSREVTKRRGLRESDRLRQIRSSAAYDITLTLVNPQPERINASWNIREGLRLYLDPFLSRLTRYISISVQSQHLFCVNLETSALASMKREDHFSYNEEALPHLINALEHYLPSQVSNNPQLRMIVYIPSTDRSPVYIHDNREEKVSTNAFLSHQWGGLLVYNSPQPPKNSTTTKKLDFSINLQQVMEVFIPQLKVLLGIKRHVPRIILPIEESDATGLTRWEVDSWLRRAALENIAVSTATLDSLVHLTDKVVNMVINEDIAAQIIKSLEAIESSRHHLKSGLLQEAFISSKRALVAAETAFFDPSLLELLYFQDDQKYGIYMPLFIPMGLPLFLSAIHAVKYLLGERRKAKLE